MKIFPGKFSVIAAALLLGISFTANTARAEKKETELTVKMTIIGKNLKALKGQISDATKQQSSIDLVEAAKTAAMDAKKLAPSKAAEVPEASRAKFMTDYQAEMDVLIGDLGKLEDAIRAGKYDDAQKIMADLFQVKREGHKNFHAEDKQ